MLNYIYLLIGLSGMAVSYYFSVKWFLDNGLNFISYIVAFICVGFTNLIFEYVVKFKTQGNAWKLKRKGNKKGTYAYTLAKSKEVNNSVKCLFVFLAWMFLSSFSIYCTIGGQYDKLMEVDSLVVFDENDLIDYKSDIIAKQKELEPWLIEQQVILSRIESVSNMGERYKYKNTTSTTEDRDSLVKSEVSRLNAEISELKKGQRKKQLKESLGINKRSFFIYISDILQNKVSPLNIQFYSSLFPSIIIDFISPICITMFLLYWKKRKNNPLH